MLVDIQHHYISGGTGQTARAFQIAAIPELKERGIPATTIHKTLRV